MDRFGQALPDGWRPTPNYQIAQARDPIIRNFLQGLAPPASVGSYADIVALSVKTFEKDCVVAFPLSEQPLAKPSPCMWAGAQLWQRWLHGGPQSFLTFAMIGRLAELLVRTNPMVRRALQLTYSHVFMDEFQDTTQVQYDLVKTIFVGSDAVLTAVGDYKQQIMRFAMAMKDPFTPFEADFEALRTPLQNNYRSSPDLVRMQDILARAIDTKAISSISKSEGTVVGAGCEVWDFKTEAIEAKSLAAFVASELKTYKLEPRDFAILVRVRAINYFRGLEPAFATHQLHLRNEAEMIGDVPLQELLSETASEILVTLLRLLTAERAGHYWTDCVEAVSFMRGLTIDDEHGRARVAKTLDELALEFAASHPRPVVDRKGSETVVTKLLDFIGRQSLLTASPAYRQGDWLEKVTEAAIQHLEASCKGTKDWTEALDAYEGIHAVPLMTIHKSKGLEYHTVIFVGLDDDAWFAFDRESEQETCGFFVAFSRAKQRVLFSYCSARGQRRVIAPLYALLQKAGVKTIAK